MLTSNNFFRIVVYILTSLIVISYLTFVLIPVGLILSVVVYFLTGNDILKFHILQMGILSLTFFLLSVIFIGSALIFIHILVFIPYFVVFLIFALIQIFFLIKNKKIKFPIFGDVAENLMKGKV